MSSTSSSIPPSATTPPDDGLQRLPNGGRKKAVTRIRIPWRRKTKRQVIQKTPAEKAFSKEKRRARKSALADALANAQETLWESARSMRETFGQHNTEYYYRLIMQCPQASLQRRAVNRWNAYQRMELKKLNDGMYILLPSALPEGYPRIKASDNGPEMQEIREQWKSMTQQEKRDATEDAVEELKEHREMKSRGQHNVQMGAFSDARATLASMKTELERLSERTGTETMLFAVRSNTDQFNQPYVFYSSQRLADFFETATSAHVTDFALRMEGYCISGVEGVVTNYRQDLLNLKKKTAALILQKLNDVATNPIARMTYTNFDEHVTVKHGIIIENWPLNKFCNPSSIPSRNEVDVLYQAFRSGTTRFRKLTNPEWEEWEEARFQAKLAISRRADADDPQEDDPEDSSQRPSTPAAVGEQPAPAAAGEQPAPAAVEEVTSSSNGLPVPSTSAAAPITPTTVTQPTSPRRRDFESDADVPDPNNNESAPRKRRKTAAAPLGHDFINAVSAPGGGGVVVQRKARKVRSDKGVKKGPRGSRKENTAASATATAAAATTVGALAQAGS
ncbi:hypothetical protein B0H21DRAFT_684804 [Amylocystis lapponica]|nr:hypothetical protein B0H21DRAFT_684804 [Amylocystis lapponica]